MTTPAAERLYLAQHLLACEGKRWITYNPKAKDAGTLPVIYGFNNGGSAGFYSAVAIAEDGTCLGQHMCSNEGYMPHDLGIIEGSRPDRHEKDYAKHYPEGYRMEFIATAEIANHAGLQRAFAANQAKHADNPAEIESIE